MDFNMNKCKACSKELPDTEYYCDYKCYMKDVPAVKLFIEFCEKRSKGDKNG